MKTTESAKNLRHRSWWIAMLLMMTMLAGCVSGSNGQPFFQAPTVSLVSLTPKSVSRGAMALDIGLTVHNPNGLPLPIDDMRSQIALNGLSLLSVQGVMNQAVPANGTGQMTLSTEINFNEIRQLAKTLNSTEVSYALSGDVGIAGLGNVVRLPFNQRGKVDAVQLASQLLKIRLGM